MKTNFDDVGNDWTHLHSTYRVEEWRRGWPGLWDSLVEAVKMSNPWRNKIFSVERPRALETYTISLYVKTDELPPQSYVFGGQVESGKVGRV